MIGSIIVVLIILMISYYVVINNEDVDRLAMNIQLMFFSFFTISSITMNIVKMFIDIPHILNLIIGITMSYLVFKILRKKADEKIKKRKKLNDLKRKADKEYRKIREEIEKNE